MISSVNSLQQDLPHCQEFHYESSNVFFWMSYSPEIDLFSHTCVYLLLWRLKKIEEKLTRFAEAIRMTVVWDPGHLDPKPSAYSCPVFHTLATQAG